MSHMDHWTILEIRTQR